MPTDDIIHVYGHRWAQDLLRAAVLARRTSHAYLFTGADHIGKTTLARAFAQALTCTSPGEQGLGGCGQCRSCHLAALQAHPDHRSIVPEKGKIRVDAVREIIHEATLSPIEGQFKVFIITAFDRANPNAANALLKTLEEPSASTRILLISSQSANLLPTITSRCQIVNLRPLSTETVARALQENWQVPTELAQLLAGLSRGRLGWAVEMATQPAAWESYQLQFQRMQALPRQGVVERMTLAAELARGDDIESILQPWLLFWRDVLFLQQTGPQLVLHRDQLSALQDLAQRTQPAAVRRFLAALMQTATYSRQNVSLQLAMESLLLKVPVSS
ncbi:MAG: DNA polymerase III subunit delta' [Chloroflexi bacterium]|nr:DNA polymerase III subunit delta' [Chloroflexota bacterium]